ncbi:MAG: amidohydrolase [Candidatus Bathycorpusculaceae bacterium]
MLEASLVVLNANVITLSSEKPRAEAVAIYNGKIVAVGFNEEIRKFIGKKTEVVNAKGKSVVPGFVDCHVHITGFGRSLQTIDLRNINSIKELKEKLREYAKENPNKRWILGGRWDQERFIEKRYPTRWDLDDAIADKPVFLTRVCGHVGVVNSKALKLAGITRETVVEGGRIDLDEVSGEPNGILRENAQELVWRVAPKPSEGELEEACLMACRKAVEAGLTCVHWVVDSADEVRMIQKLRFEDKLPLRVYLGVPLKFLDCLASLGFLTGFGNDMVKIGFVKIFADGSLGARTAALKEPYSDKPDTSGIVLYSQRRLNRLVLEAHRAGLQVGVHAIGDRAVEMVLKAFRRALKACPRKNHRHRVEHCSVLNPKLIGQMKRLELIASIQPHFVISDFWVKERVGMKRARWVYPFKTLVKKGVVVASGSDCPVEPINPLLGVWAAVARKSFEEESLTVEEALRSYTVNAAYASFGEDCFGKIEVEKFADFVVLSDDLLKISSEKIKDVEVEMTVVGGKIVYRSSG